MKTLRTNSLDKILKFYGNKFQLETTLKTLEQLKNAINSNNKKEILETMADTLNNLYQLEKIYSIDVKELYNCRNYKIIQQITSLEKERQNIWKCRVCLQEVPKRNGTYNQAMIFHLNNHKKYPFYEKDLTIAKPKKNDKL